MLQNLFAISSSVKNSSRICTSDLFENEVNSQRVKDIKNQISQIEKSMYHEGMSSEDWRRLKDAISPLKAQLPVIMPHASFKGERRKNEEAIESQMVSHDVDLIDNPRQYFEEHIQPIKDEIALVLAYISPSRHGLKMVCMKPLGQDRREAQHQMAQRLGEKCDATHDLARASFLCAADDILYMRPELLFASEVDESQLPTINKVDGDGKAEEVSEAICSSEANDQNEESEADEAESEAIVLTYKGLEWTEIRDRLLVKMGFSVEGPKPGERNNCIFALVSHLKYLDADMQSIKRTVPHYGLSDEEYNQVVASALKYKATRAISHVVDEVVEQLLREKEASQLSEDLDSYADVKIPSKMPAFYRAVLNCFPTYQHQAVMGSLMPMLGTLGSGIRVMDNSGVMNGPGLQSCVVAPWGAGKDFMSILYELIMKELIEQDRLYREQECEQEAQSEKNKNKREQDDKVHFPIRLMGSSTSETKLKERVYYAQGKYCMLYTTEVREMANQGKNNWGKLDTDLRKAFDRDGGVVTNDTCSNQSTNLSVKMRLNAALAGTYDAVRGFFKSAEEGGPSRVIFSFLEEDVLRDRPTYKMPQGKNKEIIEAGIERLMNLPDMDGNPISLPRTVRALEKWQKDLKRRYELTQSERDKCKVKLSFRALAIGLRCAAIAYILNDEKEDAKVVNVGLYMAQLAHAGCFYLFGEKMTEQSDYQVEANRNKASYEKPVQSLLKCLPLTFNREDLINARRMQGCKNPENTYHITSRWQASGLIEPTGNTSEWRILQIVA